MSQPIEYPASYLSEASSIDEALELLSSRAEELKIKGNELGEKLKELNFTEVLMYLERLGLTLDDMVESINKELTRKRFMTR